jgi:MFS superfamily sulfate permease-like transporter
MDDRLINTAYLRQDLGAALVVFLVALPLSLGIALGSDAPLISGIIAAVVAGLVVSFLSGSQISVSGPAAGLAVTVIAGQRAIGSWEGFLVAVVLSGLLQVFLGFLKVGFLEALFPTSVIKGMVSGIGLIIMFKQVPHALGVTTHMNPDESLFCVLSPTCGGGVNFAALTGVNPVPLMIFLGGVLLLWWWESRSRESAGGIFRVPAPIVAVFCGVLANSVLELLAPRFALTPESGLLVHIPPMKDVTELFGSAPLHEVVWLKNRAVWMTAFALTAMASVQTLLSLEAVDKIDPYRRVSDPNRELVAQGVGNIVSGFFGGLPLSSVIVRSSTNVYAGGVTRMACFFHGLLLVLSLVFVPSLLNKIPVAALAAILLVVGYKLVSLSLIRETYRSGMSQFLPFIITAGCGVVFDLLTGVAIGTVVGLVVVIRMNHHAAFTIIHEGKDYYVRFAKDVTFLQKLPLKRALADIPDGSTVFIDAGGASFVDYDIMDIIGDFRRSSIERRIEISVRNLYGRGMAATSGKPVTA